MLRSSRLLVSAALLAGLSVLMNGCIVVHAITAPVTLAATTVVVAGKTAGTVVTTTGKVASAAMNAGGSVATTAMDGVDSAAKLARTGMVTFVDASNGAVTRVPWQQGMTLAGASNLAKVRAIQQSLAIVRASKIVYAVSQNPDTSVVMSGGDVVQLGK